MAMPEMEAVKDAALKYDKPTLARLAQSGQLSPTIAVMAGMMRDRIVQSEMKPPSPPTVAQEVMQPMGQRMSLAAAAQPQAPQQPQPQGQGVNQVPVPPQMFDRKGMASGGIIAFKEGGKLSLQEVLRKMSTQELQYYNRTGRLPEKYRAMLAGVEPTFSEAVKKQEEGVPTSSIGEPMAPTPSTTPRLTDVTTEAPPSSGLAVLPTATLAGYYPGTAPAIQRQAQAPATTESIDPFSATQTSQGDYITDVGYVPPDVLATQQAEAKVRDAAIKKEEQAALNAEDAILDMVETPENAQEIFDRIIKPVTSGETKKARKEFDLSAEAKAIDEARFGFVGRDPYTEYLTKSLEKAGKKGFADRALEALQMIQAGEQIREGRAGAETAIPTLLKQRQAEQDRLAAREEKMAQLQGREYERKGKAFETALGKREKIEAEERAAATRKEELALGQKYKAQLIQLSEELKPADYRRTLTDILIDQTGKYPETLKEEARKILQPASDRAGTKPLTKADRARIYQNAVENINKDINQNREYIRAKTAAERQAIKNRLIEADYRKRLAMAEGDSGYVPTDTQQAAFSKHKQ